MCLRNVVGLGLTTTQTEIIKRASLGDCYEVIAAEMGMTTHEVMVEDMRAVSVLSKMWSTREHDTRRIASASFAILLCIASTMFQSVDVERPMRTPQRHSRRRD